MRRIRLAFAPPLAFLTFMALAAVQAAADDGSAAKFWKGTPRVLGLGCSVSTDDEDLESLKNRALRHAPGIDWDAAVIDDDYVVEEGQIFEGDLIVDGDLEVYGTVRGDVVAYGDILLGPEGQIRGDVVSIGGEITREEGSEIRGDVTEVWERSYIGNSVRITASDTRSSCDKEKLEDLFPRHVDGRILFRYQDPVADEVFLVGDFNDWDEEADPMDREGIVWELLIPLAKGRYDYAFIVDGEWTPDPSNPDVVKDRERGIRYSVIHVDKRGRVQKPRRCRASISINRHEWHDFNTEGHYNRVDGFYLAGSVAYGDTPSYRPKARGEIGYAFARETWLGEIQVSQPLIGADNGLSIGFNYHESTTPHDFDTQIISDTENTLAALFLKEDFRDYYERVGGTVFANVKAGSHVNLRVQYTEDDLRSLAKNSDWAVFGKDKCFRCNPSLTEEIPYCDLHRRLHCYAHESCEPVPAALGTMKSIRAVTTMDFRNDWEYPTRGFFARLAGETAGDGLGGDYAFTKYWVDVRKYTRLAPNWYLDLRAYAGGADDGLPPWKEYYVGGIGTLPARRFKEFRGNRVVLGSLEYRVALSDDFQGAFFVDSGDAWNDGERAYDLKTDVGLALQDSDHDFRVSYTKKSEDLSDDGVWALRLNRTF